MNVFCDYIGHADLYYSMHALFEKRLGFNLYHPAGSGWQSENPDFFTSPGKSIEPGVDGVYREYVDSHDYHRNGIDWQKFLSTDIDIFITTYWGNENIMYDMIKKHNPNAKFIRIIANIHEQPGVCKNILLATTTPMSADINWLPYHAEHLPTYTYTKPTLNFKIKSFFNYMRSYPVEVSSWNSMKIELPEYAFYMHGGESDDGSVPQNMLSSVMSDSMFIWHCKPHGGCGYTARQALATGRPLIVNKAYAIQHNTLAKNYLFDMANCIDVANRTPAQVAKIIRDWSDPNVYFEKCLEVKALFDKHINFEKEADQIKIWIKTLK